MKILSINDPYAVTGSDYTPDTDIYRQKEATDGNLNHDKPGVSPDSGDEREGQDDLGRSGEVSAGVVQSVDEVRSESDPVPATDAGRKGRKVRSSAWED